MAVSRIFNTSEDADSAVTDLKTAGFGVVGIYVVSHASGESSAAALGEKGVSKANAKHYAALIIAGGSLVIVDAPLGTGARATAILERARPGDTSATAALHENVTGTDDPATPLSSALGWRVLSDNPAPLSSYLKIPTLTESQTPKPSSFGLARLSPNPAPLSSGVGLPILSGKAAPLSSAAGIPVLSSKATPFSSWIGRPVLSGKAAPLSAWLKWRLLSDSPAPLSALLGLPVLLKHRSRV